MYASYGSQIKKYKCDVRGDRFQAERHTSCNRFHALNLLAFFPVSIRNDDGGISYE